MFGLFGISKEIKEMNAQTMKMVSAHNAKIDAKEIEYEAAQSLDVEPSVKGNKVIYYDPEAVEHGTRRAGNGMIFCFGSVDIRGNKKIFKNQFGKTERIEIFKPFSLRLACA